MNKLKHFLQRGFRGYDDTFSWGMDSYLEYYFLPAIKDFCEKRLIDTLVTKHNSKMLKVYATMLNYIDDYENDDYDTSKMWEYFGKNIGYFWDYFWD